MLDSPMVTQVYLNGHEGRALSAALPMSAITRVVRNRSSVEGVSFRRKLSQMKSTDELPKETADAAAKVVAAVQAALP